MGCILTSKYRPPQNLRVFEFSIFDLKLMSEKIKKTFERHLFTT